jgi:ribosomal protein L7/L12
VSVKKRKQAKALQDLVRRIPLTNTAGLLIIYFLAANTAGSFELMMEGPAGWWVGLVIGGLGGVILFAALQRRLKREEGKFKARLQGMAQKMESSADEEDKSQNKLLDAFEIQYLGGHPGLKVAEMPVFGTLEVYEKSLIFKNKSARIKMAMTRLRRVSLELDRLVRHKKLASVKLPVMPTFKNRMLKVGYEVLRKLQRYVMLDYQDDIGERHLILFYPTLGHPLLGNPLKAKAIKASIDDPLSKYQKEKKGTKSFAKEGGTGKLSRPAAAREATPRETVPPEAPRREAAATVPPAAPVGSAAPADDRRFQVSMVSAGSTPEEQSAVAHEMARIFGLPEDKAHAAVQRLPLVIKRNLTEAQAGELYQSLSATGAQIAIEAMSPTVGASPS